jgi:hypothetical protein
MPRERLTASSLATLTGCMRKYYFRYELGLQHTSESSALTFGSAWHRAMEERWKGGDAETALNAACWLPKTDKLDELQVATLTGLLTGYYKIYDHDPIKELRPEQEFQFPLTGSRSFDVAGKIDGLGIHEDGRPLLLEHKTTSDSLEPDSDYWLRLRCNNQIMQYCHAARTCGHPVELILYDVTRKPSIRQKTKETVEEYGARLTADTLERPTFYFARREVPILDQDLDEFVIQRLELSHLILGLRRASRSTAKPHQAWPRNCSSMTCNYCDFASFCLQNIDVSPASPPAGFTVWDKNPELQQAAK